jgi:hypothetical protein
MFERTHSGIFRPETIIRIFKDPELYNIYIIVTSPNDEQIISPF